MRWHCPPDTEFEILTLAVRGRYWIFASEQGKTFCLFETWRPQWVRTRDPRLSKQGVLTTAPGPPPSLFILLILPVTPLFLCCYCVIVAYLVVIALYILSPPALMPSLCYVWSFIINAFPLGTRRCYDFELTSLTLIESRNNVVCLLGYNAYSPT